jgi:hypothetical protein
MVATLGNLPPPNAAFFVFGWSRTSSIVGSLPFDLGVVGAPGCALAVSDDFVGLLPGSSGAGRFGLAIRAASRCSAGGSSRRAWSPIPGGTRSVR